MSSRTPPSPSPPTPAIPIPLPRTSSMLLRSPGVQGMQNLRRIPHQGRCQRGLAVATVKRMKTTVILMLVGALIGVIAASFIVPPALAWYTAPGGLPQGAQIQAVVQIPE